jgi:hypothetical protein
MTSNRQFAEKAQKSDRSEGNLGQKKAAREEAADAKLDHMGDDTSRPHDQAKKQKDRDK